MTTEFILVVAFFLFIVWVVYMIDNSQYNDRKEVVVLPPKEEPKTEKWSEISLGKVNDKCPKCGDGILVYSHSNIGLRVGSRIEYYYCIRCKMDTVAGKVY